MVAFPDTYRYRFMVGGEVVLIGVANDLQKREQQLRKNPDWSEGRIERVGEKTTRDAALAWEFEEAARGMPARL